MLDKAGRSDTATIKSGSGKAVKFGEGGGKGGGSAAAGGSSRSLLADGGGGGRAASSSTNLLGGDASQQQQLQQELELKHIVRFSEKRARLSSWLLRREQAHRSLLAAYEARYRHEKARLSKVVAKEMSMLAARRLMDGESLPTDEEQSAEVSRRVLALVGPRPIRVQRLPQEELVPLIDEAIHLTLHPPHTGSSRSLLTGSSRSLVGEDHPPAGGVAAGEPPPVVRPESRARLSREQLFDAKPAVAPASRATEQQPLKHLAEFETGGLPPPPSPEIQGSPRKSNGLLPPPVPSLDMML